MPERPDDPPFISGRSIRCPDCHERIEWMRPPTLAMLIDGLTYHANTRHGIDDRYTTCSACGAFIRDAAAFTDTEPPEPVCGFCLRAWRATHKRTVPHA